MIWLAAFGLSLLAGILVLWPLRQGRQHESALSMARQHYKDRLAELTRQRDSGEISEDDFNVGESEEGRRLLAMKRGLKEGQEQHFSRPWLALLGAGLVVPLVSFGLYIALGKPNLPDQPLSTRANSGPARDMADALRRIELHLARNPDDLRAYTVAAPVYLESGRFLDAANAYKRIMALSAETAELLASYGESLVADQSGMVNAEAKSAFERAVALDSEHGKSLFYLALSTEQDGDVLGAIGKLKALHAMLEEGPGKMRVAAELQRFVQQGRAEAALPAAPSAGASAALGALPPDERRVAILGMVEGLQARLLSSGGTGNEWQRLLQAWIVLGERDKAKALLAPARANLASDTAALSVLNAFATTAGLEGAQP